MAASAASVQNRGTTAKPTRVLEVVLFAVTS
jgi:hypothetical protein